MLFKPNSPIYATELEREQGKDVMYINTIGAPFVPSIAEDPSIMTRTIDLLGDNPNVSRVVYVQQRNYSYPHNQILLLAEIARIYNFLTKQEEVLSQKKLALFGQTPEVHEDLQYLLSLLKQDPLSCYLELENRVKDLRKQIEDGQAQNKSSLVNYTRLLERFLSLLKNTKLVIS